MSRLPLVAARGFSLAAMPRLLLAAPSLVVKQVLYVHRLTSLALQGTRNLPRPGIEPVSSALAGGLPSIAPPGKSLK